jgi:hypothetical protein
MRTSHAFVPLAPFASFALAAAVCTLSARAHADTDAKSVADARELATAGMQLQTDRRYAECAVKFDAAHRLYPEATTVTLRLAECLAGSGKMVEAGEAYRALAATPIASNAPSQFKQAQQQGKAEADELEKRIPQVTITVDPSPPPSGTQLHMQRANDAGAPTVEVLDAAWIGTARRVNPGTYTVFATAPGYASKTKQIVLAEGDKKSEALMLSAGEEAPVLAGTTTKVAGPGEQPPPSYVAPPETSTGTASKSGLLLGAGLGVFAAGGSKSGDPSNGFSGGSGLGHATLFLRFGKFLLGTNLEYQAMPFNKNGGDTPVTSFYAGLHVGLLTTAEKKVAFRLDGGLGPQLGESIKGSGSSVGVGGQLGLGPSFPLAKNVRLATKGLLGFGSKPGAYVYAGLAVDLSFEIPFGTPAAQQPAK